MVEASVLDRVDTFPKRDRGKEVELNSVVTGEAALRPDGNNLFIKITIDPKNAVFHCQGEEHAGTHEHKFVRFLTNADCVLHFSDRNIFDMDQMMLKAGVPTDVAVCATIVPASCVLTVDTVQPECKVLGQPKIVVP